MFRKLLSDLQRFIIKLLVKLKIVKRDEVYYIGGSEALPPPLFKR